MDQLESVWVETTTMCNLRCRTCGKKEKGTHMPYSLFEKIADQVFPNVGEVVLTGIGEPTVTDRFYDMCHLTLKTHGRKLSLITNAMQFGTDEKLLELLVANRVQMAISVDGIEKTYETIRRGASWHTLESVMEKLNAIRYEKHPETFLFGINFVLNRENKDELETLVTKAKNMWGADYLCVIMLQPFYGNDRFFQLSAPVYFKEEANRILDMAKKVARDVDLEIALPAKFNPEKAKKTVPIKPFLKRLALKKELPAKANDLMKNVLHRMFFDYPVLYRYFYRAAKLPRMSCPVFYERLYFSVKGDVSPCCGLQQYILGNVVDQSVSDIKASPRYKTLMDHVKKNFLPYECHRCGLPFGITRGNPNQ